MSTNIGCIHGAEKSRAAQSRAEAETDNETETEAGTLQTYIADRRSKHAEADQKQTEQTAQVGQTEQTALVGQTEQTEKTDRWSRGDMFKMSTIECTISEYIFVAKV